MCVCVHSGGVPGTVLDLKQPLTGPQGGSTVPSCVGVPCGCCSFLPWKRPFPRGRCSNLPRLPLGMVPALLCPLHSGNQRDMGSLSGFRGGWWVNSGPKCQAGRACCQRPGLCSVPQGQAGPHLQDCGTLWDVSPRAKSIYQVPRGAPRARGLCTVPSVGPLPSDSGLLPLAPSARLQHAGVPPTLLARIGWGRTVLSTAGI